MMEINELRCILGQFFKWNKARLDCFSQMLLAMFVTRTVNLSEIAVAMQSQAEVSSRYKRLQRFFAGFIIDYDFIARFIFKLFFSNEKIYLAIDRTNWFWGKAKINVLTLAIAHEGAAIPLFWKLLDKAGNATAREHQEIIERFIKVFGSACIIGVLGDREFASGSLFKFFNQNKIPFYIRIKDGSNVKINKKKFSKVKNLFNHLNPKQKTEYQMSVFVFDAKIFLAASRSETGELMVVATNQKPKNAVAVYLRRWEIETLFSCLKGRGFRFEETHLTFPERIEKMMVLLAIGFCWAHKTGEWRASIKAIRWCKHQNGRRPQNSYFRYGLDYIREIIINPFKKIVDFKRVLSAFVSEPHYEGLIS